MNTTIIKPDGVSKNVIGQVVGRFEAAGLRVIGIRMLRLSLRFRLTQKVKVFGSRLSSSVIW